MELFLNLVWFGLSASLVAWWVRCVRPRGAHGWTAVVALLMLLLLLLPAISMTDDLQAMNMPAELEHSLRHELARTPVVSVLVLETAGLAPLALCAACASLLATRIEVRTFTSRLRMGLVRSVGTRPPTRVAA